MSYGHHYSPDAEHAAATAVLAGTDTNCGNTYKTLVAAVKAGLISQDAIDVAVKRLFTARFRLGMFDPSSEVPYAQIPMSEDDSPQHRELALKAARESMVLLKNEDNFLPLNPAAKTIAVIGPNAASLAALEGNYNAVPSHPVLPVDGIREEFKSAKVVYAQGSAYVEGLPVPVPRTVFHPFSGSSEEGLRGEYFASADMSGKPVLTRVDPQIDFDWNSASPALGIPAGSFGVRWSGTITAPAPGDYMLGVSLAHCYPCGDHESYTIYLDGKQVAHFGSDEKQESRSSSTPNFHLSLADTRPHDFRVEYTHHAPLFGAGLTLNWQPPAAPLRDEAVKIAQKADVIIAFVGLSPELEGEEMPVHVEGFSGGDRTDIDLPAVQEDLLKALHATGKPMIVVLMNGSALAVELGAAECQGGAGGVVSGRGGRRGDRRDHRAERTIPAGRLPVTFYASNDQLPAFTDYSMKDRTYRYFHGQAALWLRLRAELQPLRVFRSEAVDEGC